MLQASLPNQHNAFSHSPAPTSTPSQRTPEVVVGRRSNAGCWTCRLRKKKCDETHPICNTCSSLDIPCYSYGPRPTWMNGGPQEKIVVQEIKRLVNLSVRRRLRRNATTDSPVGQAPEAQRPFSEPKPPGKDQKQLNSQLCQPPLNMTSHSMSRPPIHAPSHAATQNTSYPRAAPTSQPMSVSSPLTQSPGTFNCSPWINQQQEGLFNAISQEYVVPSVRQVATPTSTNHSPLSLPKGPGPLDSAGSRCMTPLTLTPATSEALYFDFNRPALTWEDNSLSNSSFSSAENELRERDMSLLAYYTDYVFYAQFPFYKPQQHGSSRGWLLSLLIDRGPSYHACLSLSASYQLALLPQDQLSQGTVRDDLIQDSQRHSTLAIQDMQSKINQLATRPKSLRADSHSSVNLLFAILQLTILSVSPCRYILQLRKPY
jgi:Fungal specific transcription factor domain/Fungal Zn(2)-Cys(6) binuclear cluster domain